MRSKKVSALLPSLFVMGACARFSPGDPPTDASAPDAATSDDATQERAPDAPADAAQPDVCPGNLVKNGDFEMASQFWEPFNAILTPVEGRMGGNAMRVCQIGPTFFGISDSPSSVEGVTVGQHYQLRAWVRSLSGSGSKTTAAVIREQNANMEPLLSETTSPSPVTPNADWQAVVVPSHVVSQSDAKYVEAYFFMDMAAVGVCFDIDDVCLQRLP